MILLKVDKCKKLLNNGHKVAEITILEATELLAMHMKMLHK